MDASEFTARKTGDLVKITEGGCAFVPDLLPISVELSHMVNLELEQASLELGRLDGHGQNLPDPQLLIAPFLRKEAVLSSRIEGTQTTFSDLVLFEAMQIQEAVRSRDNREVSNYVNALLYGLQRCKELPLGKQLLCEMHHLLLRGIEKDEALLGSFRTAQVHIAPAGVPIQFARFVPPPPYQIPALFDNLQNYLAAPDDLPLLVRLAIVHYQFETIHPFMDGNGRLGRLLIVLMLCAAGRLAAPMLYLSAYFERRRGQYTDLLLNVSREGRWEEWILFFLRGIATQARDAVQRARQLQALRKDYNERLKGATDATHRLVDELFKLPVMTNKIAERATGFSWQSARDTVKRLEKTKIIMRVNSQDKEHIYLAPEIIAIVDAAEAVPPAVPVLESYGPPQPFEITQDSSEVHVIEAGRSA
ncbi:MAG TPA: Fic family protein [Candidatus Tumulicola sp.]|jgi:Fic family protein